MENTLGQYSDIVSYKRGHVLFIQGNSSLYLYLVVTGEVILFDGNEKRLVPVDAIGEKDFVGHQTLFNDSSRRLTAIVSEDAEVFLIKKSDIKKVLKTCPDWVSDILKILSDRLQSTNEIIYDNKMIDKADSDERLSRANDDISFYKEAMTEFQSRRGVGV